MLAWVVVRPLHADVHDLFAAASLEAAAAAAFHRYNKSEVGL